MTSTFEQNTIENSKKTTELVSLLPSHFTSIREMELMYQNHKEGQTRRRFIVEYLHFLKKQMLILSKEQKNNLKMSYPIMPDQFFIKKMTFFTLPISILRKSHDLYSICYVIETHTV